MATHSQLAAESRLDSFADVWIAPTALPVQIIDPNSHLIPWSTWDADPTISAADICYAGTERWVAWAAASKATQTSLPQAVIGAPRSFSHDPRITMYATNETGAAAEDEVIDLTVKLARNHLVRNIWDNGENPRVCHAILQRLGELSLPTEMRAIIHCSPNKRNLTMVDGGLRAGLAKDLSSIILLSEEQRQSFRENGAGVHDWQIAESGVKIDEVFVHLLDDYSTLSKNNERPDSRLLRDLQDLEIDIAVNVGRHGPQKGLATVVRMARQLRLPLILIGELDASSERDTAYSKRIYDDYDVLHLPYANGLTQEAYDAIINWQSGIGMPPVFRVGALTTKEKLPFIAYAECGILGSGAEEAFDEQGYRYVEPHCLVYDEFLTNGVPVYAPKRSTMNRRGIRPYALSYDPTTLEASGEHVTSELERRYLASHAQSYYNIDRAVRNLIEIEKYSGVPS